MKVATLADLQESVQDRSAFGTLTDYLAIDGVYYVDPRPEMIANERLREQIRDFQQFLVMDLWTLSK